MDRSQLGSLDGSTLIDRITGDVHDTTKSAWTDGDSDGIASIGGLVSADQTLSTYEVSEPKLKSICQSSIPSIAMHRTTFSPKCC